MTDDFLSVYGRYTQLHKRGNVWQGLCPLSGHSEKTPSFTVYPDTGFYCYGCKQSGSVMWFMRLMGEQSTSQALVVSKTALPVEDNNPFWVSDDDLWKWHYQLRDYPPAIAYLEGRGIGENTRLDAILGWTGNDNRLRPSHRQKVIVPYLGDQDEPLAAKLRSIDKKEYRKWGRSVEPFGMFEALTFGNACRIITFLVESELDALLLSDYFAQDIHYKMIAAPAQNMRQEHIDKLLTIGGRRVLLADSDESGEKNAVLLQGMIPALEVFWTPNHKDIGECYQMDRWAFDDWLKRVIGGNVVLPKPPRGNIGV